MCMLWKEKGDTMTKAKLHTLTATLPNGETITRTTAANYRFVAIALNPYSEKYEVQGWSANQIRSKSVSFFDPARFPSSVFDKPGMKVWGATERKVASVVVAVN